MKAAQGISLYDTLNDIIETAKYIYQLVYG